METSAIAAAYLPFADELRAGGFAEPADGWNAAQIGAHIALSNEQFADLADRLRGDAEVDFDNSEVSDPARLADYARRCGDLSGLADAVVATAQRLGVAYGQLTPGQRAHQIPVRIWHEGELARDNPMPIGDLIVGNGDYHLAMHHKQLNALRAG